MTVGTRLRYRIATAVLGYEPMPKPERGAAVVIRQGDMLITHHLDRLEITTEVSEPKVFAGAGSAFEPAAYTPARRLRFEGEG